MTGAHDLPIDPSLLPALLALLSERHVSRAARRMGLTQSAMSRVLARLRNELGDPLLVRAGRSLVLTPRAERLEQPLRRALDQLVNLLADERVFEPGKSRRQLRIASADYGTVQAIVPALAPLLQQAPGLSLGIEPLASDFDERLQAGTLDFALAPRRRSSAGLVWSKLCSDRFVSALRTGHPSADEKLTLSAFCALSHVVVVPEQRAANAIDRALAERGKQRHVALRVDSFLAAALAVSQSDLVLTAPEGLLRRSGFALHTLRPPLPLEPLTLSMAWHERQRGDPGHAFVRQLLKTTLGAPA